ncbi:hypothetical protein LguiA_024259 [Lonicera macranthoides]
MIHMKICSPCEYLIHVKVSLFTYAHLEIISIGLAIKFDFFGFFSQYIKSSRSIKNG